MRYKIKVTEFTLVELLIVVSIILILMSMLLPSLQKTKNVSREIICKNNLKQLGYAANLYSSDNISYLPSAIMEYGKQWPNVILDYLGGGYWNYNLGWLATSDKTRSLYECPSGMSDLYYYTQNPDTKPGPNYGYNMKIGFYSGTRYPSDNAYRPRKIESIQVPSQTFLLSDVIGGYGSTLALYRTIGWPVEFRMRHCLGANIYFMDNHVTKQKSVPSSDNNFWLNY